MRKLVLLAVAAMAALAFAAPSASAAPVELENHIAGGMCNPCAVHLIAEPATLTRHTIIGEISFQCRVEADITVASNGVASVVTEDLVDHPGGSGNCEDLVECDLPETTWGGSVAHTGAQETFSAFFCIDPPLVAACEGIVTGNINHAAAGTEEAYEVHLVDVTMFEGATATNCEFTGEFALEEKQGGNGVFVGPIEIHHL